jgi:hypothetical protein
MVQPSRSSELVGCKRHYAFTGPDGLEYKWVPEARQTEVSWCTMLTTIQSSLP